MKTREAKETKPITLRQVNMFQCIGALITGVLLLGFVFIGIVTRIVSEGTDIVSTIGLEIFRMYTILSNCLCAACAMLAISYCVEGLLHQNYHMPRWIVIVNYFGTCCVGLTFLISLCVLSPIKGFYDILFAGSNLFLHLLGPLLAIVLFIFVNSFHTIKFKWTLLTEIPTLIYAIIYIIMVFGLKRWEDYYSFGEFIPWPLTMVLVLGVAYGINVLFRFAHNKMHNIYRKKLAERIKQSEEFKLPTIEDALKEIAFQKRALEQGGDITVPRMLIRLLKEKYQSALSFDELGKIYLASYFAEEKSEESDKK